MSAKAPLLAAVHALVLPTNMCNSLVDALPVLADPESTSFGSLPLRELTSLESTLRVVMDPAL